MTIFFLLCGFSGAREPEVLQVENSEICALIAALGSDQYMFRDRAEKRLKSLGIRAFDALKVAERHDDVEIAARANYLTHLVNIPWTSSKDSEEVRKILGRYPSFSDEDRLMAIYALAALANGDGQEALCRIVRFEESEILSKKAGLQIVEPKVFGGRGVDHRDVVLGKILAQSKRPGTQWVKTYLKSWDDPQTAPVAWARHVEAEKRVLETHPGFSETEIVLALMRRQVFLWKQVKHRDEVVAVIREMLQLEPHNTSELFELVDWLIQEEAWTVIDQVAEEFGIRSAQDALLLYALAQARSVQGKRQLAEEAAKRAEQLNRDEPQERLECARLLMRHGYFEWAEREYRFLMTCGLPSLYVASGELSLMLHDLGKNLSAAKVLQELVQGIQQPANPRGDIFPDRGKRDNQLAGARARMEYYFSIHNARCKNWEKHHDHLQSAVEHNPTDADVLISMYQFALARPEYRVRALKLIDTAANEFREEIRQDPDRSAPYNKLAWLISNTEGDYDEALRCSQKSLELVPGAAGYMDTLAHCYFAKGDYKNAVRVQRQAALIEPHTRVIVLKLKMFEQALESQGDSE